MQALPLFDSSGQSPGKLSKSIVKRAVLLLQNVVVFLEQRSEMCPDPGRSSS